MRHLENFRGVARIILIVLYAPLSDGATSGKLVLRAAEDATATTVGDIFYLRAAQTMIVVQRGYPAKPF